MVLDSRPFILEIGIYEHLYLENPTLEDCILYTYNVCMLKFDWDPQKDKANQLKHGISFEEAQSVFFDDYAIQFDDEEHSAQEDRYLLLGMSSTPQVLIVCHCERESGSIIRLISARKATAAERKYYRR